jgi:PAS domain S-box-containing protein
MDNTILRNAVLFYAALTHDLCEKAASTHVQTGPVMIATDLSHHILQYLYAPNSSTREAVARRLKLLAAQAKDTSSPEVQRLLQQGTVIYNNVLSVDETMRELTNRGVRTRANALQDAYLDSYSEDQRRSQSFLTLLYAASVLMLGYLTYMFFRVQRKEQQLTHTHSVCVKEVETRKRAQHALQESETKYRTLVEHIPAVTYVAELDEISTTKYVSPQVQTLIGLTPEQCLENPMFWSDYLHPGDRQRVLSAVKETQTSGKPFDGEYRLYNTTGEVVWVSDHANLVCDNKGVPQFLQGAMFDITEHKQALTDLQESETFNRLLLDSTGEGIYGVNLNGLCTFINPAALRMLAIQKEDEVLGKNIHKLIHHTRPDGTPYPANECRVYQAYRRGEGIHVDDEVLWKTDGISFPAEYQSYPLHHEGKPVGAVVTFTDISERKRTEKALLDSQAQLADAQRIAHIGNWSWNLRTNELTGSEETFRIFGIEPPPENLTFETLLEYVHPEDRQALQQSIELTLNRFASFDIVYRIVRPNGIERIIHSQGDVSINDASEPLWLVGTVQDVTGTKHAEEAQRRYAERLRILNEIHRAIRVARSPEAIAAVTLKHVSQLIPTIRSSVITFDFADNSALVLAAEGTGLDNYGPETRLPMRFFEVQLETLRQGRTLEINDTLDSPLVSGALRPFIQQGLRSVVNVPLWVQEELIGSLNLTRDEPGAFEPEHLRIAREIADSLAIAIQQSRLHQQIKRHAEELEAKVVERTAALVTANKELESFSYSVSHDLRAPLRSIDGFSLALFEDYEEQLGEEGKHYIDRIRTATQHMAQLIDDLLALARVTRVEMQHEPVNLTGIARETAAALHRSDKERKVEFVIQDGLQTEGDPVLLRVVVENLVGNAWKFTSHHETARIEFGGREQDNECVYFVIDDGAGFDDAYADKLFKPFQRLHTPQEFEGTGIGLATVKRIIERHDGRIWVEGEVEKGARVYFAFPKKREMKRG